MKSKIINMNHKECDYQCMWDGIENMYMNKTGQIVPKYLFFALSGFGESLYLKDNLEIPHLFFFTPGIPELMYQNIGDIVGFKYNHLKFNDFSEALEYAKKEIDNDNPTILGALDMYHLKYLDKYYHKYHIRVHFVSMVGYDDEKEIIYLYDGGRKELQELSYSDLSRAWDNIEVGFSDKFSLFTIRFSSNLKSIKEIFYEGLLAKCQRNLDENSNQGINSIKKLASEISSSEGIVDKDEFINSIKHIIEYASFPPKFPSKYTKINEYYTGARYQLAELLNWGAKEYSDQLLEETAELFFDSGEMIRLLVLKLLDYLKFDKIFISEVASMLNLIYGIELSAYKMLLMGLVNKKKESD